MFEPESMKLVRQRLALGAVDLIHRHRHRLPQLMQHPRQIAIDAGDLTAPVDQKNDVRSRLERHPRLFQNLRRDHLVIVGNDAAGIDQIEFAPAISGLAVNAVPRDPGLVAHDRAPLPDNRVKQRGLADVRPPDNDHRGK